MSNTLRSDGAGAQVTCAIRIGSHSFPFLARFIPAPTSATASPVKEEPR